MWCYHCVPLLVIQLVMLLCAGGYTQYDRNQSQLGEVDIENIGSVNLTPVDDSLLRQDDDDRRQVTKRREEQRTAGSPWRPPKRRIGCDG